MAIKLLPGEQARDIPALPGYKATNFGRIISFLRYQGGKEIRPHQNPQNHYMQVLLRQNGKSRQFYVHRLVAETFCPNPENKKYVNHIDESRDNNFACNLEWVTNQENCNYGYRAPVRRRLGMAKFHAAHPDRYAKSVIQRDRETKQIIKIYDTAKDAADALGVTRKAVTNAAGSKTGRLLRGCEWEYFTDGKNGVRAEDLAGNMIGTYETIADAARKLNCNKVGISRCCWGKLKTCYGMRFSFI